ncbi:hypothetical protein PCANC_08551 [Puccinia coronata f. sp. avenae]|uniref:ATPase inhibitor, mitochondrial n=1 Tax=Puccinia coronata f. sp. avenae TaxID=200324 RepID=A0A2N5V1U6_9BASI|nr:hypothetical protein PCASD_11886 [Puccinia coronata f. sp. avenae]PLW34498.1 hypothetical protein PCASD_09794 [Puccinia coronata f. sp. avenae]PLW43982.1 hypothetical protein PCANC_08551 [Puccinia coronata f. sp. avenae]
MSTSISLKSRATFLPSVARQSTARLYRPCVQRQFSLYTNPVFRPDNAVPTTDAKGFQKRERGEEGRYAREKEVAELKELRDELAKQKAKIEQLEKSVNSKK